MASAKIVVQTNASHLHNDSPVNVDQQSLLDTYEQLRKLQDAILRDAHPRLRLSGPAKQRLLHTRSKSDVNGSNDKTSKIVERDSTIDDVSKHQNNAAYTSNMNDSLRTASKHSLVSGFMPTQQSSGIDPVLLTKSKDLVNAEHRFRRQRTENDLKDAWDRRKHTARDRDSAQDTTSLDALAEVLQKAQQIVRPVTGLRPAATLGRAGRDSSFDTNDYYSSQVDDGWSSEEPALAAASFNDNASVAGQSSRPLPGLASNPSLSALPISEYRGPEKNHPSVRKVSVVPSTRGHGRHTEDVSDPYGEESDYSPPAVDAFTDGDADADVEGDIDADVEEDDSEYDPEDNIGAAGDQPSPQAPVFANTLTQMAAPQASRVSPLAIAKEQTEPWSKYLTGNTLPYEAALKSLGNFSEPGFAAEPQIPSIDRSTEMLLHDRNNTHHISQATSAQWLPPDQLPVPSQQSKPHQQHKSLGKKDKHQQEGIASKSRRRKSHHAEIERQRVAAMHESRQTRKELQQAQKPLFHHRDRHAVVSDELIEAGEAFDNQKSDPRVHATSTAGNERAATLEMENRELRAQLHAIQGELKKRKREQETATAAKRPYIKAEPVDSPPLSRPEVMSAFAPPPPALAVAPLPVRAQSVVPRGPLPLGYVLAQNGQLYWGYVRSRP